jgi:hypothetical protein
VLVGDAVVVTVEEDGVVNVALDEGEGLVVGWVAPPPPQEAARSVTAMMEIRLTVILIFILHIQMILFDF